MVRSGNNNGAPGFDTVDVLSELDRILLTSAFRTSRRSHQFLRYVVKQTLEGRAEEVKERSLGIALFDRAPGYNTSEDATVRVAANEVRKRLAQAYRESPPQLLRIDLPPGSYVPEFHSIRAAPAARPKTKFRRLGVAAAAAAFLALLALAVWQRSRPPFDDFWAPLLESPRPALVCLSHPVVYVLSERVLQDFTLRRGVDPLGGPYVVNPEPGQLNNGDVIPAPDGYVGSGDAYASNQFAVLFTRLGKAMQQRIGNDLSFTDLRSSPAVLIGAYSNRWTMQENKLYRFGFDHFSVVDRGTPHREWKLGHVTPDYKSSEDYAIVTRVLNSYSGEPLITAAGITNMGTRAASEFLTNPMYLNAALAKAPAGWRKRNLQFVLHCQVIGVTPGPPRVIASHFW